MSSADMDGNCPELRQLVTAYLELINSTTDNIKDTTFCKTPEDICVHLSRLDVQILTLLFDPGTFLHLCCHFSTKGLLPYSEIDFSETNAMSSCLHFDCHTYRSISIKHACHLVLRKQHNQFTHSN